MKKEFNVTGTCFPSEHYMMDNSKKFGEILELIERGKYFSMHHPRQFGKTTMMETLVNALKERADYLPIRLSFQGIDRKWHESDEAFGQMFMQQVTRYLKIKKSPLVDFLQRNPKTENLGQVSDLITDLVMETEKKLVVLIDEVDASSNYAAFLNFLAMLRTKYLERGSIPTFHSIVLIGVHDIKNLKFKLRDPEAAQYNSPWNIAADFDVDLSFHPPEIAPMLVEYCEAEGITMDIPAIAERLYYHTSGYPFLVTKLCKNIAEKILKKAPNRKHWTLDDVETSVQMMLQEENTNFESLTKNLENHPRLYNLTYEVLVNGLVFPFNPDEPITKLGRIYGIFKKNGRLKIHNRIYEQRIYNYMVSKRLEQMVQQKERYLGHQFETPEGGLNFERVLRKFQAFMKEQRSKRDVNFLEREWRLIFLAFLKPILNGIGHDFKEVETSDEKRLDVVVTYLQYKYILELKIWRGTRAHEKGLTQLANYLDIHGVDSGFLLIFDTRKELAFEAKTIEHQNKSLFTVWV